jgi:uncharacterized protein YecT (DUF1311 family)
MFRSVFLLFITFVPITSWAGDEIKCNETGNQSELDACAHDDFVKEDKKLNQAYQALIKNEADNKLFVSKLRQAQRAWLAFRDSELEARFACAEDNKRLCWGSMYPSLFLSRKAELTRERTEHLQQILRAGVGQ